MLAKVLNVLSFSNPFNRWSMPIISTWWEKRGNLGSFKSPKSQPITVTERSPTIKEIGILNRRNCYFLAVFKRKIHGIVSNPTDYRGFLNQRPEKFFRRYCQRLILAEIWMNKLQCSNHRIFWVKMIQPLDWAVTLEISNRKTTP